MSKQEEAIDSPRALYINGAWVDSTGESITVASPFDRSPIDTVPAAGVAEVNAAVEAAHAAFDAWRFLNEIEKNKLFLRWADEIENRAERLAEVVGKNAGTAADGQIGTVHKIVAMIRYYAGLILTNYGEVLALQDDHINMVVREPLGTVGLMPPWNSPIESTMQKLAPALAAGNSVVLRLPEEAPLGGIEIVAAAARAGFPAGVINMIVGGPDSGVALVEHPHVRLISFTGSVPTGKRIAESCAKSLKRVVLELGGKAPLVVFADADPEAAADAAVTNAFAYQGQICCAATRVLAERSVVDALSARITELAKSYNAPGTDDSAQPAVGPIFNTRVFEATKKYVELGRRDGTLLAGGEPFATDAGYYFQPTVFSFDSHESPVTTEEIFGPVLAIVPFDSEREAIEMANHVVYGLATSVWTRDRNRLLRCVRRLHAGTVWANTFMQFNIHTPWGGFKESGVGGREFGIYGMRPYQEEKAIWIGP